MLRIQILQYLQLQINFLDSGIIFISRTYTGRIWNKKIKLETGFLDHIPQFSTIMAGKDFNVLDKRPAKNICFEVPPVKEEKHKWQQTTTDWQQTQTQQG